MEKKLEIIDLDDKVIAITGASSGIGEMTAYFMASKGAHVIVSSRKQPQIDQVAQGIQKDGFTAEAVQTHVGKDEDRQHLIDHIRQEYGRLDALINNAGINPYYGPALECEEAAYDKIMDVNLKAPFQLSRQAHPLLKASGGAIVNISSEDGIKPDPDLGVYSISKAGLNMMTKVLAKEWGPDGIRVNAVCPGLIRTTFSEAIWQDEEKRSRYEQRSPLGRIADPDEVAGMIAFLASDAASYCTGGIYTVDGGQTI